MVKESLRETLPLRLPGFQRGLPLVDLETLLVPKGYKLLPSLRQKYEFELAAAEAKTLTPKEIVERGAYFQSVGGQPTNHYLIAEAAPVQYSPDASETRKLFFKANKFSVGYATHGLFPYRGKFHPQMIKAIINIIGVKPGQALLDPMAGSGTALVEACIMGINSVGIELNPFTVFMSKVKLCALDMDCSLFPELLKEAAQIFNHFSGTLSEGDSLRVFSDNSAVRDLALLSYLDTLGYARRRKTKSAQQLFPGLLKRYLDAVGAFNRVRQTLQLPLGTWQVIQQDARKLAIPDNTVDAIVFSPPYSFALDYVENDRDQLEFLGVDPLALKRNMIGLRSDDTKKTDISYRVQCYYEDMQLVFNECARVLKRGRYCVVVIGSNTQQTGGVRLESEMVRLASKSGLDLDYHLVRDIEGIRNTMKEEHVLFFVKPR